MGEGDLGGGRAAVPDGAGRREGRESAGGREEEADIERPDAEEVVDRTEELSASRDLLSELEAGLTAGGLGRSGGAISAGAGREEGRTRVGGREEAADNERP